MSRNFALVVTLVLGACAVAPNTTTLAPKPATAEEIEVFCDTYELVRNQSRQEMMIALYEIAPLEVRGPIKRASERASTFEDDSAIWDFVQRCG